MDVNILEVQDKMCMLRMWFLQICLILTFFLKTLYTCIFLLDSVILTEFAKKGSTFESWYNMEMYQLKDKSFIMFFCDF